ncbi:MAG TPA: helix-turn-helix domain-containing protein [Gaiellaceae bacterium]|nr:helix-turn-helix domain-containing protein [Gaiellaceae bacterium]
MTKTVQPAARVHAEGALLDAAERLLVEFGYGAVTTRRLGEEAGVNHGLVHYYFGSIENVMAQTLERFTDRLIERQRALYAGDEPFLDKWRQAMTYLEADARYQKIWLELQAFAWSRPDLRARIAHVTEEWRVVLTEAFAQARDDLGLALPLPALVALVATFNQGMMLERQLGIDEGHAELLDWIEESLNGDD